MTFEQFEQRARDEIARQFDRWPDLVVSVESEIGGTWGVQVDVRRKGFVRESVKPFPEVADVERVVAELLRKFQERFVP